MSRIRIVVADQAEAIFYDAPSLDARPSEVARVRDVAAHRRERDLGTDRPGRTHAPLGLGDRHAFGPEPHLRREEAARFAKLVARLLDEARRRGEFDDLVLVAGAPFLGLLRPELPRPTADRVARVVPKDLVHGPVEVIGEHLQALGR